MPRLPRWLRWTAIGLGALALVAALAALAGWLWLRAQILDSGGKLRPLQAAYDVRRYDLEVAIDPATKRLRGRGRTTVVATAPLDRFEIQLDGRLKVESATVDGAAARFEHEQGLIGVTPPAPWAAGERHVVEIAYAGRPKIAARPPWIDGLVWEETPSGAPWLGVTTQGDGGDDWWPCKDHPSDEPDEGISIALTLPSDLVGLANGRKVGETANGDGTTTTRWEVSYPINNYLVSFNAAPYVAIEERYRGADGTLDLPMTFWAIPEHVEKARKLWATAPGIVAQMARRFGEYPFLADKLAVVEAPYKGMEHQTLVAWGGDFEPNEFGFDDLLLHELAHEWWGNKLSVADWADFWVQEGFATYAEALYVLDTQGEAKYLEYMRSIARRVRNREPVVGAPDSTAAGSYNGDIYTKGACVLHSLKWLVGDETFFSVLHRFATDERFAYKLVSTADFERVVAEVSGRELPWFWRIYLHRAAAPEWTLKRAPAGAGRETIALAWDDPAFELPLPVEVGGEARRIEMPGGRASFEVDAGAPVAVDPGGRIYARGGAGS